MVNWEKSISEKYEPFLREVKKLNDSGELTEWIINQPINKETMLEIKRMIDLEGDVVYLTRSCASLLLIFRKLFRNYGFELSCYLVDPGFSTNDFYNVGFYIPFKDIYKIRQHLKNINENFAIIDDMF